MPTHAAFLRAVNLGPRRRVPSDGLRVALEELGFVDVQTFRASGNVVFGARRAREAELRERIERGLRERFGFEVPVFLRTAEQLRRLVAEDPFPGAKSVGKLQVALLQGEPAAGVRREVLALATEEDRLAFGARELLWLPSGGTQRSGLDLRAIEKRIGPWTLRTMDTISAILARFFEGA